MAGEPCKFTVHVAGWGNGVSPEFRMTEGGTVRVDLKLAPAGLVCGGVLDAKTRKPIENASVGCRVVSRGGFPGLGSHIPSMTSDGEGRFTMALPRGTYSLSARKSEYEESAPQEFEVELNQSIEGVEFLLTPRLATSAVRSLEPEARPVSTAEVASISGQVVQKDTKLPVVGAHVFAVHAAAYGKMLSAPERAADLRAIPIGDPDRSIAVRWSPLSDDRQSRSVFNGRTVIGYVSPCCLLPSSAVFC